MPWANEKTTPRRKGHRDSQRVCAKCSQAVDAGGDAGGAEAVVDIHDGDVRGAGIQHTQQRGDAAEAGAVADAGGNGDHRRTDKAADNARQRAFHARHTNNDARLR